MEFNALGKKSTNVAKKQKADLPVNLAVRLERIEIAPEKPGLFHGFDVATGEAVTVRLMTINEGVEVNKRAEEDIEKCKERLRRQYAGDGEAHRPRPSEVANASHKTHCEAGGLLMFTKAKRGEDGIYRAHWVETLERSPGAGCDRVMAHIKVEDRRDPVDWKKVIGTQVGADVLDPEQAVLLNKSNVVSSLLAMYQNTGNGIKRKPFVQFRLVDAKKGDVVLSPRAHAQYTKVEVEDPDTGDKIELNEAAPAKDSLTKLMSPEETKSRDVMTVRAALFGLGDQPGYPEFKGVDDQDTLDDLHRVTDYVRSGALLVEAVPGEYISAGPATRASYIKGAKNNPNDPVNTVYAVRNENGSVKERRFTETYLSTKVGRDGHRYFTKAVPADCYPRAKVIAKLATVNDHTANATAAVERSGEAKATSIEVADDEIPFDPSALGGVDDVNRQLAQSASVLDADIV